MVSTLGAVTTDCGDAAVLATFWSQVLGVPVASELSADFASISLPATTLLFVKVPENKVTKNRVHLDMTTPDLDAETARLVSLGARRVRDITEHEHRWVTLADPEGNEFDLFAAG